MKRYIKTIMIMALMWGMVLLPTQSAQAGLYEIIKAAVVKVIKAVDLQIQRLQNRTIWLQNAQKELENAMSRLKLREISDWTEKQREQYDTYFKELWRVKNAIATYNKVRQIVQKQLLLAEEYRRAWGLLQRDGNFNRQEIEYMSGVYSGMLEESLKNLDQLMLAINSFRTQMSDGKRLELIDRTDDDMDGVLADLRTFNDSNFRLSVARARDAEDAERLKKMYGLD